MKQKVILLSAIIVTLVFAAAAAGFIAGLQKGRSTEVAGLQTENKLLSPENATKEATLSINQSTSSGQISESEQLVNSFYRWYINCLNENGTCDYKERPDIDYQKIMDKTTEISGYDRLLCAQNTPVFFQVDHSLKDEKGAESVYVVEHFGNEQVQLIAEVEKTSTGPKIINIICPRP
jgi:type IV secretory pathway component VirB8